MLVYYFTKEQYALDIIKNKCMKLSLLNNANDPFELMGSTSRKGSGEYFRDQISLNWGMLCFSEDYKSPLMWGHYSSNHTGICLGFEISDHLLVPVSYRENRYNPEEADIESIKQPRFVKSLEWNYEKEYRYLIRLNNSIHKGHELFFIEFDKYHIELKEILLGYRNNLDIVSLHRTIMYNNEYDVNIPIYKTKLSDKYFQIVRGMTSNIAVNKYR